MKCFVITLLLLTTSLAYGAKDKRLLVKCLGDEEKRFHLNKDTGPLYELNQRLISEMVQIPSAELSNADFEEICNKNSFSSSWKLLELSIRKGKDIFQLQPSVTGIQRSVSEGMISDYMEATKEIFLSFVTSIQSLAPSATCLKEEIPQLDAFFTDIKYLQEDVDIKQIFRGRDVKIFQKLKDYPQAFGRCKERLKKKLKSSSKPAPKKS